MRRRASNEPSWRRYLRFWRRDPVADINDELQFHFASRIAEFDAAGMSRADALEAARRRFGDVDAVRDDLTRIEARIVRRWEASRFIDALGADLRYVFRGLRRTPGFTAAVLVTLAIGIGLNAALFSFLDRVFVRPPNGVLAPREVRRVYEELSHSVTGKGNHVASANNYLNYAALRDAFAPMDVAAYTSGDSVVVDHDASVLTKRSYVSANFFSLLGVRPAAGRTFAADEGTPERPVYVAVISDALWRRVYGGDRGIVGRRVQIDDESFAVVGVAASEFAGIDLDRVDVWTPLGTLHGVNWRQGQPWYAFGGPNYLRVIARDPPGQPLLPLEEKATVRLNAIQLANRGGDSVTRVVDGPIVEALGPTERPDELSVSVRIGAVAAIILLIACANVANLLMLRGAQRGREIAVRRALGVSRARLRGLVLAESFVLAVLSGGLAVTVAFWAGTLLRHLLLPRTTWAGGTLDLRVLAFLGAVAVVVAFLAGLAPSIASSNPDVMSLLRRGPGDGARRSRLRSALVVLQTALSVVLLVGAALFVRSLRNLKAVDVGYDAKQIAFTSLHSKTHLDFAATSSVLSQIATAMRSFPGVTNTAVASSTPLRSTAASLVYLPGSDSGLSHGQFRGPWVTGVSADFFATAGIARLAGRVFDGTETATSEPVVVVSERFAKLTWPGRSALGECLLLTSKTAPCARVIGVVADVHTIHIVEDPETRYYVPLSQSPLKSVPSIIIRASPATLRRASAELTKRIAAATPAGTEIRLWTVADAFAPELRPWLVGTQLFLALGMIALVVAAVGIYSVASYTMSQRANEIGIRLALGAKSSDIFKLAARGSITVLGVGAVLGVVAAVALGRFVASLLFGVTAADGISLAGAALLLVTLGVIASVIPAWRASQIDPVQTLKSE